MTPRRLRVAAAACAVVVLLAGCGEGAAPTRVATPSATSATSLGLTGWLHQLPIGPPPEIGYVIGHSYHSADGRTIRLPLLPPPHHGRPRGAHLADPDEVLARFGTASWLRPRTGSVAWEDAHHLLLGVRPRGGRAAVVRLDTRSGAWTLAVDLTPLEGTTHVAFDTGG